MSDAYIESRNKRRGQSVEELLDQIDQGQSNPDDLPQLVELIDSLTSLRDSPEISRAGSQRVQEVLEGLQSGDSELTFVDPRDALNGGPNILGGLGTALDFGRSVVGSTLNQAGALERIVPGLGGVPGTLSGLFDDAGVGADTSGAADRPGLQGFLSGLSTGDDTVGGLRSIGLQEDFGPDLSLNVPDAIPALPDRIPLPDLDTLGNLGVEIATDPFSFTRAPALISDVARGVGATTATAAASRAGRKAQLNVLYERLEPLGLANVDNVIGNQVLQSVREGGLTTLIRDARKGVNGLSMDLLDDLGVQRGLTVGGEVVKFTEGAASALGAIRVGGSLGGRFVGAFEKFGEGINQSAIRRFTENMAANGASPLEYIPAGAMLKASALQSRDLINLAGDAIRKNIDSGILDDLSEERLRGLLETDEIITQEAAALRLADDPTTFQRATEDLVSFMDDQGLRVSDLERGVDESPLAAFIADGAVSAESRILAPAIAFGMQRLQGAARKFVGDVPEGSFAPRDLIGPEGVINHQSPTLRRFMEQTATINVFGKAGRLDTLGDDLADRFFALGNAVPDEILDSFGQLADDLDEGLDALDQLTGATEALAQRAGDTSIPAEFEKFISRTTQSAYDALANGDLTRVRQRLNQMVATGNAHTAGLRKLTERISRGNGKAVLNTDRAAGRANTRRARAMSDEVLEDRVHQILKNEWFNPEIVDQGELAQSSLLRQSDQAVIREAYQRNPEMVNNVLGELDGWINEWTEVAQETFARYDEAYGPVAEQMKNVDTFYQQALTSSRIFGQAAEEAVNGVRREAFNKRLTQADAEALADQLFNTHMDAGKIGTAPGMWSTMMHENTKALNALRREPIESAIGQAFVSINRVFRSLATFGSGFITRNFKGQVMLNYFDGVRATGRGGYREFEPVYQTARAAIRDEAVNFGELGTSALWDELPSELREQAIELAESGVLTTSGVGGAFERAFQLQEQSIGNRVLGGVSDTVARGQTRIEQGVVPGLIAATSGRAPTARLSNFRNAEYGLQASTRVEIEAYMRGSMMWNRMRNGGSIQEGLDAVSRNHFDYWDFTAKGQTIDEFMPFWLFRARITTLAAGMTLASPGIAAATYRAREMNKDRDPYGLAQQDSIMFGSGNYRGVTWALRPDSPLDEGFNNLTSVLGALGDPVGFAQEEIIDPLAPAVGLPVNSAFNSRAAFGEVRGNRLRPVRGEDGLSARFAEVLADSPLGGMMQAVGGYSFIDGEPVMSDNAQEYLTNILPILGRLEGVMVEQLQGEGEGLDQEEIDKRVLNSLFSFTGVPWYLVSDANRAATLRGIQFDVEDYDDLVRQVDAFRPDDGPSIEDLLGG